MTAICITDPPASPDFVRFPRDFGQRFIVTVDAEEEFDWNAPIRRDGYTLETIPELARFQEFCEEFRVVPSYLIDYPLATSPETAKALGSAVSAGRAEIGVQLHPWVSPPFEEEVSEHNSFTGNLPPALERAKFSQLRGAIEAAFGTPPKSYRAGRYGAGPITADMLADGGIAVDTSVRARFDYSAVGGPNYRTHPLAPYWLDRDRRLMELPLTTVFRGPLRRPGEWLYPRLWRIPRLRGALARSGLLERIALTPEGIALPDALKAVDTAIADGLPVLVFSFHSPSLAPGHTPYVHTQADLEAFYAWWRAVFTRLADRGIRPTSVAELTEAAIA